LRAAAQQQVWAVAPAGRSAGPDEAVAEVRPFAVEVRSSAAAAVAAGRSGSLGVAGELPAVERLVSSQA